MRLIRLVATKRVLYIRTTFTPQPLLALLRLGKPRQALLILQKCRVPTRAIMVGDLALTRRPRRRDVAAVAPTEEPIVDFD
jgi:hypothetical protein